ncbi:MAG: hypothetical protein QXN89_03965 [Candidatus Woesearchaeota archaeon]
MKNSERYEEKVWSILYELAISLIDETGVNILFNKAIYIPNGEYKFVYMGDKKLFQKIFDNLKKLGLQFDKSEDEIFEALTNEQEVYQHSRLGFAPTVLDHDHPMTFYMIEHIPVRSKEEINTALSQGVVTQDDVNAYKRMQDLEKYLGYEFEINNSKYTSIVTIYPLTPLGLKIGFAVVWCPYKVDDINEFRSTVFRMSKADIMIQDLLPKISALFTLLRTLDLVINDIKPDSNVEKVLKKFYPKEYALQVKIGKMSFCDTIMEIAKKLIEDVIDIKKKSHTHALRSAIAAIMARNMSHNIGSHVLASPDLLANLPKDKITDEIQTLHNFLQQRMDFISQVVTYQPTYAEPCFFFRDMLRNFLTESLLLGHLIKDIGYDGSKIEFHVLCNGQKTTFDFNCETGGWWRDSGSGIEDIIVGVPGGYIGFHAFYDIIENMMRNSAKYGIRKDKMNIYIQLEDKGTFYLVTVWDDLSPAQRNGKDIVADLNEKLKERLIDEMGEMVAESRGIHEMKKCAAILVSPFEKELNFNQYDLNGQLLHIQAVEKSYNGQEYLGYQFFLQKPRLVTIVGEKVNEVANRVGVFTAELEDLIKHPPQIALIFESEKLKLSDILSFISQNHHLLPYRILLVRGEGIREDDQFHNLPHNRAAFCNQSDIQFPSNTGSMEEWEKFVIDVHKLWLKKRYGDNKYMLAINIDRDPNHIAFTRWGNCLKNFWLDDILDIFVTCARQQGGWQGIRAVNPQQSQLLNKQPDKQKSCLMSQINERYQNVLLYDNHGALTLALGIDRSLCRFYHETGIKVALRLSQALESPPETPFAFNWFVLGLLEAGLTTVVIVDERLGEATFGAEQGFNKGDGLLGRLREAGIFPIYKFNGIFISDALESTNNRWIERGFMGVIHSEGMQVNDGVSICAQKPDGTYEQLENADVIIIHQGVIDRLHEMGKWQENFVNKLYQSSPSVIITSGRGKTLRHVPVTMPFLEFSIIRACTYAELSKYHLVRAIKSVVGSKKKEVNKP